MFRWVLLALVSFIYMLVAADRSNLGIALPSIKAEFHISNAQAGLFSSLLFWCLAAAQLPSSLACRRYGARYIMLGALLVAGTASFLIGTSRTPLNIEIFRSILGIAEASISVSCMATINHWFSVKDRGTATGYYWGASKMGPVLFPPIAVIVLQTFGWRAVFQLFAVPVLLAAFAWFFFVQNRPELSRFVSKNELEQIRNSSSSEKVPGRRSASVPQWIDRVIRTRPVLLIDTVSGVFRSWNLMGNIFATFFLTGIFNVFLAWIPSYLVSAKHLSLATAGILSSILFAGAVAGNLSGGWLSDNVLGMRRKPLMMLCTLFSSAALIAIIYVPGAQILLGVLLAVMGFVVGLGYSHFTIYPMGLTTREIYPVAFGLVSAGSGLAGGLFPFVTGVILDAYSWDMVFIFLSGSALVSFFFLLTIHEPSTSA